jgi:GPH family glycoside/pentoside/hexuronide:cation symporter
MFLSLLPALGSALSVALIVFYPLTEKKMLTVTKELEALRKQ